MNTVFKLYLFYQDNNIDNWDNIILKIIINDLYLDNQESYSNSNSEMMTRVPTTLGKLIFIYILYIYIYRTELKDKRTGLWQCCCYSEFHALCDHQTAVW